MPLLAETPVYRLRRNYRSRPTTASVGCGFALAASEVVPFCVVLARRAPSRRQELATRTPAVSRYRRLFLVFRTSQSRHRARQGRFPIL
jgi:hypothetical protein